MVRQLVRSALAGSSPRLLATVGGLLLLGALLIGLSRPAQLHLVRVLQQVLLLRARGAVPSFDQRKISLGKAEFNRIVSSETAA